MTGTPPEGMVLHAFERTWNRHDLAAVDTVYSNDYVVHDYDQPDLAIGAAVLKHRLQIYRTAFPDLHFAVTAVSASAERVTVHWHATATHTGWYGDIAPTGEGASPVGYMIYGVSDSRIHEVWVQWELIAAPPAIERLFGRRIDRRP